MEQQAKELRVLVLEDTPTDAELMQHQLRETGLAFTATRVETQEEFVRAVEQFAPDIILADYELPHFDGLAALAIAREKCPDVPFMFVTGKLGEERAVETLRQGAVDYVLKDRLSRLGAAVQHALKDARIRKEKQTAEVKLHEQLEELRRFEKVAIGREQRMQELKDENVRLAARLAEFERVNAGKKS